MRFCNTLVQSNIPKIFFYYFFQVRLEQMKPIKAAITGSRTSHLLDSHCTVHPIKIKPYLIKITFSSACKEYELRTVLVSSRCYHINIVNSKLKCQKQWDLSIVCINNMATIFARLFNEFPIF